MKNAGGGSGCPQASQGGVFDHRLPPVRQLLQDREPDVSRPKISPGLPPSWDGRRWLQNGVFDGERRPWADGAKEPALPAIPDEQKKHLTLGENRS